MDGRKRLSGAEYRKIAKEKKKKESDVLSSTPKLDSFFKKTNINEGARARSTENLETSNKEIEEQSDTITKKMESDASVVVNEDALLSIPGSSTYLQQTTKLEKAIPEVQEEEKQHKHDKTKEYEMDMDAPAVNEDELLLLPGLPGESNPLQPETNVTEFSFDFKDPGSWPQHLNDSERCYITRMMCENENEPNLSNSCRDGRSLTKDWFFKVLKNGTKIKRSWLSYSESKNALYCIPCRLFPHLVSSSQYHISSLAKEKGFINWKKLNEKLPEHENSSYHKLCFCSWKTLESCLGKGGIDKELQNQIKQEESHWKEVLRCIIDAVLFLAKQGSPFRGTKEAFDFSDPASGKFLNTIDLISHYSVPLQQHIERHKKGQVSYFSHKIQDEFLEIIAKTIRQNIIQDISEAKYFSLIFDCTPDVSHNEQMTQVIRYVKINSSEVEESFVDFLLVSDKTGEGISQEILRKLEKDGINIQNCRGQSYDNGANMAGKYKGVQSRLLQENGLAYFVPCAAHSLNLVGANAASVTTEAQQFFGTLNSLYSFFVTSTLRWEVLKSHVPLTMKSESKTRWYARLDAVEPVYKYYGKVLQSIEELKCHPHSTPQTKSEARSLLENIQKLEFVVMMCFWYVILKRINNVSEFLQREDLTVDLAARNLEGLKSLMKSCREFVPSEVIIEAKYLASINDLPNDFTQKRLRKKKKMPGELCDDEVSECTEDLYKVAMTEIIDRLVMELDNRYQALESINDKFGFLSGAQINKMQVGDLKSKAAQLADFYIADLNKDEFVFEIESFKYHGMLVDTDLKDSTATGTLNLIYKNKLDEAYPNLTTALRIFLTIPVTVSSGERSFSKLKIVKNYLRSTMAQQRLSDLSIISIESKRAAKINFDEIINSFAAKKARKVKLV